MLANLKFEGIRLWSQNGLRCDLGDRVAATTQALVAELSIARCPLSAFGLPATEELTMELVTGNDSIELEHTTIGLSATRVVWRSRPVSVHGSPLLRAPANYILRFRLGGREVGHVNFRVLNEADLVAHLRVAGIQTEAETRSGERVPGLRTLRWEEHQAFFPTIQIENGVVAPNSMVRCIARILRGTAVVRREEFLIRLDAGLKRFKLQRMELGSLGLRAEPKPTRLVLSVCIGGEVKGSAQVLVLPPERITNFEGQLTFDAAEIPFDQTEYEQIAQRLGLEDDGACKQSFWAWLKRWGLRSRSRSRPESGPDTRQQTSDTVDL